MVGYLFFKFKGNLDRKLRSASFVFETFDDKIKKLKFDESDIHEEQLFFDDTIWEIVDMREIEKHPVIRGSMAKQL